MKYRLIKDDKYIIQIFEKKYIFFGCETWEDSAIMDFKIEKGEIKADNWMEYHKLIFNEQADAELVYDSIIENNILSQKHLRIILEINEIEILRED